MLLQSSDDLMSTEMKPNPESLMAFQYFPYTSRKIQDGQCFIIVTILLFLFLNLTKMQTYKHQKGYPLPHSPLRTPYLVLRPPLRPQRVVLQDLKIQ